MKNYFRYQFKKFLLPLTVLFLFAIIMYVIPLAAENYKYWNFQFDQEFTSEMHKPTYIDLYTDEILTALAIMCVVMPIYAFSYKMNKRSVDTYYSVPLTKTKLAAVHFIVGFVTVIAAFSAAYLLGFIVIVAKVKGLRLIFYLWIYLASLIPAFCIYTITAFFYTRANTVVDGIIFVLFGYCLFGIIVLAADHISNSAGSIEWGDWSYYFAPSPLAVVSNGLQKCIYDANEVYSWSYISRDKVVAINELAGCLTVTVMAIACTLGLFFTEKHSNAENCGQISESIFGYKSMIPIYTVSIFISLSFSPEVVQSSVIAWCAIAFCAFIMTVIYKRTLKIGKKALLLLSLSIAVGLIAGITIVSIY